MDYFTENDMKMRMGIDRILTTLPPFCRMYFLGREQKLAVKTLHNTSFTIRNFFNFISKKFNKSTIDLTLSDLNNITAHDIENFMAYLSDTCTSGTIGQTIYTLNSFFRYYYRLGEISSNPVDRIDAPERKEKPIIRLTKDETKKLMEAIDVGYRTGKGKRHQSQNQILRDKTIMIFFLSTGIRVSELVGLDYGDIDFANACFQVRRKGGRHEICYMTNELIEQLKKYLIKFPKTKPTDPMFTSVYKTRAGKASIEAMVRQYSKVAGIEKKITPHKLRSTFGTNMYEKTRDIYLVADLLGHKDVYTTTKHYTTIKEEIKRKALDNFTVE